MINSTLSIYENLNLPPEPIFQKNPCNDYNGTLGTVGTLVQCRDFLGGKGGILPPENTFALPSCPQRVVCIEMIKFCLPLYMKISICTPPKNLSCNRYNGYNSTMGTMVQWVVHWYNGTLAAGQAQQVTGPPKVLLSPAIQNQYTLIKQSNIIINSQTLY